MQANYRNTVKKLSGNTSDIVSVVMETYNKDWQQVGELAKTFRPVDSPVWDVCKNIFDYIINNVRYKEDPAGVQWVKTPARLIADGVGDCKSMSIFSASCLRSLGIDHFFRFVSFNKRKEATHVYVVAVDENGRHIILDPVVRPVQFNKEEKYTYKSDMRGTDIYYLSGIYKGQPAYEPAEIGEIPEDRFDVWHGDNENVTPGKISLYAKLDYLIELAGITEDSRELSEIYNQLDMISLAIDAFDAVDGSRDELRQYYHIIASMVQNGALSSIDNNLESRAFILDSLKKDMHYLYERGYHYETYDIQTLNWLTVEVLDRMDEPQVSGLFDLLRKKEMAAKMKEAGMYYIYIFISDAQAARESVLLQRKRNTQLRTLRWQEKVDIWHNYNACIDLIRSGIIAKTGKTPERWLADARKADYRIGEPVTAVIGIITAILGLIKLIIEIFGKKEAPPPTNEEIEKSVARSLEDGLFTPKIENQSPTTAVKDGGVVKKDASLPILAAAGLTLFLMKN